MKAPKRPCYTPGPWEFDGFEECGYRLDEPMTIYGGDVRSTRGKICGLTCDDGAKNAAEADAHLIAAAPELFEALEVVVTNLKANGDGFGALIAAEAALAKAKGEA